MHHLYRANLVHRYMQGNGGIRWNRNRTWEDVDSRTWRCSPSESVLLGDLGRRREEPLMDAESGKGFLSAEPGEWEICEPKARAPAAVRPSSNLRSGPGGCSQHLFYGSAGPSRTKLMDSIPSTGVGSGEGGMGGAASHAQAQIGAANRTQG